MFLLGRSRAYFGHQVITRFARTWRKHMQVVRTCELRAHETVGGCVELSKLLTLRVSHQPFGRASLVSERV